MRNDATIPAQQWAVAYRYPGADIEYRRLGSRKEARKLRKHYRVEGMETKIYRLEDDGKWHIWRDRGARGTQ